MGEKRKLLLINGNQFGYSSAHYYYCKYLKENFEIEYVCYDREWNKMYLDGVNVNYVPFKGGKIKRIISFVRKSIIKSREFRPDILFVVYFNICLLLSIFCRSKLKILDIRTGSLNPNAFKRKIANLYLYFQSLFFRKKIILSENLRELIGIPQSKSMIMPLGAEVFCNKIRDFQNLKLLYVGSLDGRNIAQTIDGINIFLSENINSRNKISYTIIGFGSPEEEKLLTERIAMYQLQSNVSFEGIKNHDDLVPYFEMNNIGIGYVPMTEYYQRQPLTKIFEYGVSGMFIIATDTYENRKLITETNGLICNDNAYSFAEAIKICFERRLTFNSDIIRSSFKEHNWKDLVLSKLYPFITS